MKNKCLLLSTFSTFQTPLTTLTNSAMIGALLNLRMSKKLPLVCKRFPCQWNYSGAGRRSRLLLSHRSPEAELRIERVCGGVPGSVWGGVGAWRHLICKQRHAHNKLVGQSHQKFSSPILDVESKNKKCYYALKPASAFAPWQIIFLAENLHRQSLPV